MSPLLRGDFPARLEPRRRPTPRCSRRRPPAPVCRSTIAGHAHRCFSAPTPRAHRRRRVRRTESCRSDPAAAADAARGDSRVGRGSVDSTIISVALPAIERDLGGGLRRSSGSRTPTCWRSVADPDRRLAGRHLRRAPRLHHRLAGFGVFSVVCALAPTIDALIAARALQGGAAALVTPSSLAIIVAAFAPKERGAAIGSWTAWGGIASIVGPLAGGLSSISSRGAGSSRSTCRSWPGRCAGAAAVPQSERVAGPAGRRRRRGVLRARAGRLRVRADRAAALRLAQPRDLRFRSLAGIAGFAAFLAYERRTQPSRC